MVERRLGQHEGNENDSSIHSAARIEEWRNIPQRILDYEAGPFPPEGNTLYEYSRGTRLLMGEEGNEKEVMDSCQTPWANATVDRAFEALGNKKDVNILERGFGMGIVAEKIIHSLVSRSGTYTVIELNKQVADYAKGKWKKKNERSFANMVSEMTPNPGPQVSINIIEGDAYEETRKLAEEGRKFDIIVSDTFPLSEEEKGINDLIDLETLKQCLSPDGIFTFFGYYAGSQGGIGPAQKDMVLEHFEEYSVTEVTVNPPPDYKYFQPATGPVRKLPVIICKRPKL